VSSVACEPAIEKPATRSGSTTSRRNQPITCPVPRGLWIAVSTLQPLSSKSGASAIGSSPSRYFHSFRSNCDAARRRAIVSVIESGMVVSWTCVRTT
jgi:hypothetical protein